MAAVTLALHQIRRWETVMALTGRRVIFLLATFNLKAESYIRSCQYMFLKKKDNASFYLVNTFI